MLWTNPSRDIFLCGKLDAAPSLCFLNRMSDEQGTGAEAVGCESHVLTASRTKTDIGCASVTNSREWRDRSGICWRHFGCAEKKCLVCSEAGKNHCLNGEQLLARDPYGGDSVVGG